MAGLGRGLGSLIPQKINKPDSDTVTPAVSVVADIDRVWQIKPSEIKANSEQPRRDFNEATLAELAASIKEYGILQPLVVSRSGAGYELIAGERRLRAAKLAGLVTVPAIIRPVDEQKKLELALIENIQREDLNAIDTGLAYRRLLDEFNLTVEELGKRIGKSSPVIVNTMRLLSLPEEIRQGLIKGLITEGHAKIIVGLVGEAKQMELYHKIIANKMTVANTAIETRKMGGTKKARIVLDSDDEERQARLKDFFNSPVTLKRKDWGGQIIIDFKDDESLAAIMEKIR